jgi:hypothetical protein
MGIILLEDEARLIVYKNSVRTSKRTTHFTITRINWLMLFKFNPLKPKLV